MSNADSDYREPRQRWVTLEAESETKKPRNKSLSLQEPFYLSLIISLPWLILKSYFAKG